MRDFEVEKEMHRREAELIEGDVMEEKIRRIFLQYPDVLYGLTSISYSPYAARYRSALVLAVPYGGQLTLRNYAEERFESGIQAAQKRMDEIFGQLEAVLQETEVPYDIPPMAQENEEELAAPFSYKFAAVHAGLGWIGKNDVVITEKYGPRVRLGAILIDHEFAYGEKVTESRCPVNCTKCVDACPYKALRNVPWKIDALRKDLIDYKLCNQKRSLYMEKHGRKNACGLCMAACPIGT